MLASAVVLVIVAVFATTILALVTGGESHDLGFTIAMLLGFPSFAAIGALILARQPRNTMGRLFLTVGLIGGLAPLAEAYAAWLWVRTDLPSGWVMFGAWVHGLHWFVWMSLIVIFMPLLYPDGRFLSTRWRRFALVQVAALALFQISVGAISPRLTLWNVPGEFPNPIGVDVGILEDIVWMVFLIAGATGVVGAVTSVILRYRRSRGDERLQMKWFTAAVATFPVSITLSTMVLHNGSLFGLSMVLLPVAMGVAVLKYRLYDIDVVISKTVVFAGLAAFITGIYVAIVVGIGTLIGSGDEPNLALSIVATALVAVAFQPVRERLTKVANRLVFGKRATPYEVLSRFSSHLGETVATDETLEKMVRLLADGTGAARAQVWLKAGRQMRTAASWPADAAPDLVPVVAEDGSLPAFAEVDVAVPVTHQGQLLGALTVTKNRGEGVTPTEQKLIDDLAAQAGLVVKNVQLTADLLARLEELGESRRRLVAAQDEERRRLERDLHDGAQQQLVALRIKLGMAKTLAEREDAPKTAVLVEQVAADADDAVATLRELAHGIYPPLLAAEGLAVALQGQARKAAIPVEVVADGIGRYPQEVEAAVYFCVLEALNNVAKYAGATRATVTLAQTDGHLTFTVVDDGVGFDPPTTPRGHGLTNMTDRLHALDGRLHLISSGGAGTTVEGSLLDVVHAR